MADQIVSRCYNSAVASATLAVPKDVLADLPKEELVLRSAPARLAPSPVGGAGIDGTAVLTSTRVSFVPGPARTAPASLDPLRALASELWALVKPAVFEAFPLVQMIAARQAAPGPLAGRGRPGIEIPLQMLDGVFAASSAPGWLAFRISLPPTDPRPPYTLYLHLGPAAEEWLGVLQSARAAAPPKPELERVFALYYLFRELPTPWVWVGRGTRLEVGQGRLCLVPDGIALTKKRNEVLLPFEATETVRVALDTRWRSGFVELISAENTFRVLSPRRDFRSLSDLAYLVAELSGARLEVHRGPVAVGRVAFRAAWLSAAGAGLAELARLFFF